jgi:hypothetical protein
VQIDTVIRRSLFVPALAGLTLLAAGCGGGSSPSVASLGTTTGNTPTGTTTPGSSASGGLGPATSGGSGTGGVHSAIAGGGSVEQLTQYAACMRKNGVPNFPDPNTQGQLSFSSANGFDPRSAAFQHAQQGCQKLIPNGRQPSPAQQAQERTELLTLAQCMRKHGYPSFPDPDSQGAFDFTGASAVDPNSLQFQSAMSACRPSNGKVPLSIGIKATSPPPEGKP